jgi:hypothetical protein
MIIHYGDIIMYFAILILIWLLFGEEVDDAISITFLFTSIYVIVFAILPYNWSDIFTYIKNGIKFVL